MRSKATAWVSNTLRKHWFYLPAEIIALVIACQWIPYSRLLAPGFAVAVLAVVAAVMSVHPDMLPWQKFIWLVVIGAFLLTELRAIRKDHIAMNQKALDDRNAQDEAFERARQRQDDDFAATATGLRTAITGINRELNSLQNATWDFTFDMNCENEKIKGGCSTVWNLSSTDRGNGIPKYRNAVMIYPLLENWPKDLDDPNGTPLAWDFAFFQEPKHAKVYVDYIVNEKVYDQNDPEPDLEFMVDAARATKPELRSSPDRRITIEINDYQPRLRSREIMSLDELPGSTLVVWAFSPFTPIPTDVWVRLKNGRSLLIGDKGKFRSIRTRSGDLRAFRLTIPDTK